MNLYILVGNIGSGKSTFVKTFLQNVERKTVCVCRDSLRYMIGGGEYVFDPELEPAVIESNIAIIHEFLKLGVDVIIDEVNVSREYRAAYIKQAQSWDYKVTGLVLPKLDMETSVNRRMRNPHDTPRNVWYDVWEKFDEVYEEPTLEEGFDEVKFICKNCYGSGEVTKPNVVYSCKHCDGTGYILKKYFTIYYHEDQSSPRCLHDLDTLEDAIQEALRNYGGRYSTIYEHKKGEDCWFQGSIVAAITEEGKVEFPNDPI